MSRQGHVGKVKIMMNNKVGLVNMTSGQTRNCSFETLVSFSALEVGVG